MQYSLVVSKLPSWKDTKYLRFSWPLFYFWTLQTLPLLQRAWEKTPDVSTYPYKFCLIKFKCYLICFNVSSKLVPYNFTIPLIQSNSLIFDICILRRPRNFGVIFLLVLNLLSNIKTKRKIAPKFCGLLRKTELYSINSKFSFE